MKLLFAFLTIAMCISCKKETIDFPQDLYLSKITASTDVRLFINKIEIFDKPTIDRFISQATIFNLQNQLIDPSTKMAFPSKDTVIFGSSTSKYGVNLNGNQFLFTSPAYLVSILLIPSGIMLFPEKITPIPGIGYAVNETRVGYGDFTNLKISLFSYKLLRRNMSSGNYESLSATLYNEFNQPFINALGATDTLAIQEFKLSFNEK